MLILALIISWFSCGLAVYCAWQEALWFEKPKGASVESLCGDLAWPRNLEDKLISVKWHIRIYEQLKSWASSGHHRLKVTAVFMAWMAFWMTLMLFKVLGVAICMAAIALLLPKRIFQLRQYQIEMSILQELPQFFGILNGWACIQNQLVFCMERVCQGGLSKRLIEPYQIWLLEIGAGRQMELSLSRLEAAVPLVFQKQFVSNLRAVHQRQGDLSQLFSSYEEEAHQLLKEVQKTSLMRTQYSVLIGSLWLCALGVGLMVLKANPILSDFYLSTAFGRRILTCLCAIGVIGFASGLNFERYHLW